MAVAQQTVYEQDLVFSRIAFGFWRAVEWDKSTAELQELIEACLSLGITTFDHADLYGDYQCESLFGNVLRQTPALRDQMQLVTKCGIKLVSENRPSHQVKHYDTSQEHILQSVDQSLRNLGTDYIDLLLIHRPDPLMDAAEVAKAFTKLKTSGKVKHFGVSNFNASQFELLNDRLSFPLATNQLELSAAELKHFLDGTVDQCQRLGRAPMAWSALGGGTLFSADTPKAIRLRHALRQVGKQLGGLAIDQVAYAWLLTHPAKIIPILGTGKRRRVQRAAEAASVRLSREQWYTIWTASTGHPVP